MNISHLRHNEIDKSRWDEAISACLNRRGYALSWYLDTVSPRWEALVTEDYASVMPLPVKKKYGFPYLIQPELCQQLGVFSQQKLTEHTVKQFVDAIPYRSYGINLNAENRLEKAVELPNYVIDLQRSYSEISRSFSQNTQRNIAKARKAGLVVKDGLPLNDFFDFYFSTEKNFSDSTKNTLFALVKTGFDRNETRFFSVYDTENKLTASCCLLHSFERLIYLLPDSNQEGKQQSAMFLLVNEAIKRFSETNCVLDFEGSQIEGVARFYRGFGAQFEPYYRIRRFRPQMIFG